MPDQKRPYPELVSIEPSYSNAESVFDDKSESEKSSPQSSISPQSLHTKPWPARPQVLHKGLDGWRWWDSTVDVIVLLLPIPFIILIAAVIAVNGREVDEYELNILDHAIKGATTVFPIFFAATTGRAAVKYATWKLEQGTTLGTLEQLMGSRTVASAIGTQIQLRSFNAIGVALIIVWSLSPIGSQSVLHILSTPAKPTSTTMNVSYFNSRQQSYSSPSGAFRNQWYPGFAVLFGSSLLAPQVMKQSTMDTWGNVKIPFYSSVVGSGATTDAEGWTQISSNSTPTYSSLFGLPLSGILIGNTTLTVESTYTEFACGNINVTSQTLPNGTFFKTDMISPSGPFVSFEDVPMNAAWAIGYQGPDVGAHRESDTSPYVYPKSCPDCLPSDYTTGNFDPGTLVYQEYDGQDNITSVFCMPSQQYIESEIRCERDSESQTCEVTAQRPSLLPHMPNTITPLSFPQVVLGLTALLPNSTPQFGAVNLIQNYLLNPSSGASIISGENSFGTNDGQTPVLGISMKDFGDGLGQIMNAYFYGSMWNSTPYITGASFDGIQANLVGGNNASFIPATSQDVLAAMIQNQTAAFTVSATLVIYSQVYFVFYSWLSIFFISTLVMLAASIVGVIYSRRTIVPDYLGYVSSLAKESPYIRMPDVGVNMDGMDKARLVKDVKVRLGDVSPIEEGRGR
ncbi:hypothetical protein LSUE1_G008057 [Lachnellula suecica]|uniref:Uncharacterized protein n=1 Tax=Lachnellula suecica TaxID=602035 RepID=A0A8T9BXA9_9HELO|nr:hypothetical protein LSUE1_G008057 [Lachnellula suecica]